MPANTRKLPASAALLACLLSVLAATRTVAQVPAAPEMAVRRPTIVSLPVPQITQTGELVVRPAVAPASDPFMAAASAPAMPDVQPASAWQPLEGQALPPPALGGPLLQPGTGPEALSQPGQGNGPTWFDGSRIGGFLSGNPTDVLVDGQPLPWNEIGSYWDEVNPWYQIEDQWCRWQDRWCQWQERLTSPDGEAGIGRERVSTALFEIDISQPMGNFRWRTDAAYNHGFPDRSEAFWSRPGKGPLPERGVDYQEFRFLLELGSGAFSMGTEVPIRLLNPIINENNDGVGDIQLIAKTRMMDGTRWQITQLLRTTFNNGNSRKGLGTGHVSMEPGALFRWKYSDLTYYHGELKMTFPIAGDPMAASPLLKWGIGVSTIYYETDTTAWLPTLEFTNIWFLDGLETYFPSGAALDVEAEGVFILTPGLRLVCDTGGDLGIVEFGWSAPVQLGSNGWYDYLVRADLRFVF